MRRCVSENFSEAPTTWSAHSVITLFATVPFLRSVERFIENLRAPVAVLSS